MKNQPTKDQLIANLLIKKVPWSTITEVLQAGNSRISRVSKQLKQNVTKIESAPMGRPPKVNPQVVQTVEMETLRDPTIGGVALSQIILQSLGISLSKTTINTIRGELKFNYTSPRRRPFLTDIHISNRLSFCHEQLLGKINWEDCVVLSDESRFCIRDDSRRIWIKRGVYNENTFINEKKYNTGIMVWGAIGKNWRSPLILVKGKLNSDGYIDFLQKNDIFTSLNNFYGEKNYFFEQDGAPCHRSKKTINWLTNQNVNLIENWPANSPDLSCIEQVWAILEAKIQKYKISSLKDLYECLQKEWFSIPTEKLNNLISQTPNRFQLCINENGKPIGHKLYTLKKNDKNNLNNSFIQNSNYDNNFTPILKIPLNRKLDNELCKTITQKLLENEQLPYILKIDNEKYLMESYKVVIKHHLSVQL